MVDYTSLALSTPVTPFPAIGDAAYRQRDGGGLSHGHTGNMHNILVKIARVVPEIFCRTNRQTDTDMTYSSQYFADAPAQRPR